MYCLFKIMKKKLLSVVVVLLTISSYAQQIGSSPIHYLDGKVGIGVQQPRGTLDVRGTTFLGSSGNFIFHAENELNYNYFSEKNDWWWINYRGTYNLDQFRDLYIGNGKGKSVLMVDGSCSRVGVGTTSPEARLDVRGDLNINGWIRGTEPDLRLVANDDIIYKTNFHRFYNKDGVELVRLNSNGNLGIGTVSPEARLDVRGDLNINGWIRGTEPDLRLVANDDIIYKTNFHRFFNKDGVELVRINSNGNLGIGTSSPEKKLDVVGAIRAHEIVVSMAKTADFVFEEDYNLRPLEEVEAFVKEHKHLPEVASAGEMERDGVKQSEMNQKLLQKIEELTLYVIEQRKDNQDLRNEVDELRRLLKEKSEK
jgi:hypothetical protein